MVKGSDIFRGIIDAARQQLLLDHTKSSAFGHAGIKGDERSAALSDFLRQRIPDVYEVAKGEVIDCYDHRTGQLDIIIHDRLAARPITQQKENSIIPCETLYVVVEVKSLLNKVEAEKCLKAAKLVRDLKPFKHRFVDSRQGGRAAQGDAHRCMYVVFAYESDISADGWMKKEYERLVSVAKENNYKVSSIDRVFVVDRGIINPVRAQGKLVDGDPEYLFAELFRHLVNFMQRERLRRPAMEWESYALPRSRGWRAIR